MFQQMNFTDDVPTNMLSSNTSLVHKRVGHVVASYRHFILVWGGFTVEKTGSDRNEYCPTEQLWMYNCTTEVWSVGLTRGQIPPKNSGSTGVVVDDNLYIFGGAEDVNDVSWRYGNDLYKLDLHKLSWELLDPTGERPVPCDKAVGWHYDSRIYFFSGYGIIPNRGEPGGEWKWVRDESSRGSEKGWTNQLVWYDTEEGRWGGSENAGGPAPRAAAAAALLPETHTVLVFGGRLGSMRMNDMYLLNLKTLHWSENLTDEDNGCEGRSWHSLDFIDKETAVIYGGLAQSGIPTKNWWEVKFRVSKNGRWRVVDWKGHNITCPLVWHKAAFCKATGELIMVGGVTTSPYIMNLDDHVDRLVTLQFQPASLFRLCLNSIIKCYEAPYLMELTGNLPTLLSDVIAARLLI